MRWFPFEERRAGRKEIEEVKHGKSGFFSCRGSRRARARARSRWAAWWRWAGPVWVVPFSFSFFSFFFLFSSISFDS
ncbi:hypothetical protein BRADI_3g25049v3 [Brachypodium distachyon]|uniref:Uncharacterized protein n=1 Tax=Brachypodium distachyon TaxID=15368 RepID=A0A2K2CZ72_BRADI|nr:hypothetical protein BRADI_3g25049v3 [Brachypodium distachyon]